MSRRRKQKDAKRKQKDDNGECLHICVKCNRSVNCNMEGISVWHEDHSKSICDNCLVKEPQICMRCNKEFPRSELCKMCIENQVSFCTKCHRKMGD